MILTGIVGLIWSIKTMSICQARGANDDSLSFYQQFSKYAPPEWRRLSKVLFACWLVLFLIFGFALDWK